MKVMITGADGQLGQALRRSAADFVELLPLSHAALDTTQADRVKDAVEGFKPQIIIHLAAFSDIDRAQQDADLAYRINRDALGHVARAAQANGSRLIHLSSADVFDGARAQPYDVDHPTNPVNVFGASKRAGEIELAKSLDPSRWLLLRTSWLYSAHAANFLPRFIATMQDHQAINAVVDQYARPTSARELAQNIWDFIDEGAQGTIHSAGEGIASWYDFVLAVRDEALRLGLLRRPVMIRPVTSREQTQSAPRPANAVLDTDSAKAILGRPASYWRYGLVHMLTDLKVKHAS